jgi:hypothetical protein
MTTMTDNELETWLERTASGEPLPAEVLEPLAAGSDILQLGMLADAVRRHRHGTTTTFLRVAAYDAAVQVVPPTAIASAAREVRISGAIAGLADGIRVTETARAFAAGRTVSGFAWTDIHRWSGEAGGPAAVLARLRQAGLDALATIAVDDAALDETAHDSIADDGAAHDTAAHDTAGHHGSGFEIHRVVGLLADAGFTDVRLHVALPADAARLGLWQRVAEVQRRYGVVRAVNPLPATAKGTRQTTGYDDIKMVAVARLAADVVPSVQLDWARYGPKLAQVALTVGADDLDNVSPSDDAPEGRRRAPLDEVRRNIESAGLEPVERDSRFRPVGGQMS